MCRRFAYVFVLSGVPNGDGSQIGEQRGGLELVFGEGPAAEPVEGQHPMTASPALRGTIIEACGSAAVPDTRAPRGSPSMSFTICASLCRTTQPLTPLSSEGRQFST